MTKQFEDNLYAAIIGDIKHSRKIANRKEAQEQFRFVLQSINEKYADDIASQFIITLGDSFQGLLKNKQSIMNIIFEIELAMSPIELRFGIGLGDVSTTIQRENSMEMDGTAYHRARQMIETIEDNETKYTKRETNMMIFSGDDYQQTDQLLNTILSLATALKSKWTDRQKEVMYAYFTNGENQYKTAEALGIGQSSVNKALNAAKYYTYKTAFTNVSLFLSKNSQGEE
ncbi:hypothetical protein JTF06_02600 [Desemzia sp. RIT804]|uniref:SatD family protein n=1 Tax=Desemzia sp. RIT 804 TaxID=2810209 RepID=UPI001950C79F|nr:SatD family protein [Desemzia sp. RIT 804]MBM6613782.1 hypothetical protein [Desemzia sp. RIT 804]